jgi:hypothetical protein
MRKVEDESVSSMSGVSKFWTKKSTKKPLTIIFAGAKVTG